MAGPNINARVASTMSPDSPIPVAYASKTCTAAEAVQHIKSGNRIFVGTACATPRALVQALEERTTLLNDVELVHFLTTGAVAHNAEGAVATRYRHRTFFVGSDMQQAVRQGMAEYVPVPISRVPEMFRLGKIALDVAFVQVTPPDEFGYVSLGISVDIEAAAIEAARLVIAEVNPHMPRTLGDSTVHMSEIDWLVPIDTPVIEYSHTPVDNEVVERIAQYIAGIIDDGSTLQIGLGRIPNEALKYLSDRKDLGIHSEVITDAIIPLLEKGILNGRQKSQLRGKVVTSFALGTRRLFDMIDRNPLFSFHPMDVVCHPNTIAAQHKMVSVTQAFALDLTGQVCSDQFSGEFYAGIAAQGDFLRGASRSPGGKPIICLMSTTDDGQTSRIRPLLLAGEGATIARTDVHYVVTEYGIAYLFGKSVRERAISLIEIAHPNYRQWLLDEAKALGYLPKQQTLQNMRHYPVEEERQIRLKNGTEVLLRPAKASDANGIRSLFFTMAPDDIYTRFFRKLQTLSDRDVQRLCNYNYESEVGFVAVVGTREHEQIIGQCCYFLNPSSNLAETAFIVDPKYQGTGLGSAMQVRLAEHAKSRGIRGFVAEILPENSKMMALAKGASENIRVEKDDGVLHVISMF